MPQLNTKAAVAEATDRGEFKAIAATWNVDRTNERIIPGAFTDTIRRWRASGKLVPLHWNHEAGAESIIGSVDPSSMRQTDQGLVIEGVLDLEDSALAREAWRSVKAGRIGLSFGYVATDEREAEGMKLLTTLDLFEVTLTASPANAETRVLSTKSLGAPVQIASFPC